MKLLLPFLVSSFLSSLVRGDTYVTILYGNGVSAAVQREVAASSPELLTTLNATTPLAYDIVPPGAPLARGRDLSLASRELPDTGCPNQCSNSGSTYCRIIGCAYCGGCGGRSLLRGLQSGGGAGAFDAAEVEVALTEEVSPLCTSATCELWTVVYLVNADGSLTEVPTGN
jgi:predicted metal-binding protein